MIAALTLIMPVYNNNNEAILTPIMVRHALMGEEWSLRTPISSLVVTLPIMISDTINAPSCADSDTLSAMLGICCDMPVIEVCRSENSAMQRKAVVRYWKVVFCNTAFSIMKAGRNQS